MLWVKMRTKLLFQGIQQIGNNSLKIENFISNARKKIVAYYNKNYQRLIQKAKVLEGMNKYEESLLCDVNTRVL